MRSSPRRCRVLYSSPRPTSGPATGARGDQLLVLYSAEESRPGSRRSRRACSARAGREGRPARRSTTDLARVRATLQHARLAGARARSRSRSSGTCGAVASLSRMRQARQHSSASADRMRVVRMGKASAGSSPVKTIPARQALRRMVRPRGAYAPRRCTRGFFRMLRRLQRRVPRPSSARIARRCHRSSRPAFATLSPTPSAQIVEESRAAPSASLIVQRERAKAAGAGHDQLGAEVVVAEPCASEGGRLI